MSVWYANGQLKLQGQWAGGRREGWWRRYSHTGHELAAAEYDGGERVRATGAMEDEWDQVSRYHWAVPLAFDARRLKRFKESPSQKRARRWGIAVLGAICVLVMALRVFLAK